MIETFCIFVLRPVLPLFFFAIWDVVRRNLQTNDLHRIRFSSIIDAVFDTEVLPGPFFELLSETEEFAVSRHSRRMRRSRTEGWRILDQAATAWFISSLWLVMLIVTAPAITLMAGIRLTRNRDASSQEKLDADWTPPRPWIHVLRYFMKEGEALDALDDSCRDIVMKARNMRSEGYRSTTIRVLVVALSIQVIGPQGRDWFIRTCFRVFPWLRSVAVMLARVANGENKSRH